MSALPPERIPPTPSPGPRPGRAGDRSLLVVIDQAARRTDGESVRIAKDVLCAGARAKICLLNGPEEVERALARRGGRHPVVIGDDRALLRVVEVLHRERELTGTALSVVPVGPEPSLALARSLGVPTSAVRAARAVLDGVVRRRDLLLDESGGVVLGGVRIPADPPEEEPGADGGPWQDGGSWQDADQRQDSGPRPDSGSLQDSGPDAEAGPDGGSGTRGAAGGGGYQRVPHENTHMRRTSIPGAGGAGPWWIPAARTARSALTMLSLPIIGLGSGGRRRPPPPVHRLRIEADGVLLADLDQPVEGVAVRTAAAGAVDGGGLAEVVVHRPDDAPAVRVRARAVTVSGPDFRYRADALVGGPVRSRTWTVMPGAWSLTLPR